MRKYFLILLLLMVVEVSATDEIVLLLDSIAVADTAAATTRTDTGFGQVFSLNGTRKLQFFVDLGPDGAFLDTNFVNDTFWIKFQHSFNQVDWRTMEVDTLLDNGTDWSVLNVGVNDSVIGCFGRGIIIHWDSLEATGEDIVARAYRKKLNFHYVKKK